MIQNQGPGVVDTSTVSASSAVAWNDTISASSADVVMNGGVADGKGSGVVDAAPVSGIGPGSADSRSTAVAAVAAISSGAGVQGDAVEGEGARGVDAASGCTGAAWTAG